MPRMTGARVFAEMMRDYGVSHIFFVPTIMMKAMAEMEDMPIKRVLVHGEKAAAYMADGFARASGKPGVCMAQSIGASNLAAGLRDGYMSGSPIIAISGGTLPDNRYRHTYQEIEDFSQFGPVTKFSAHVEAAARLPDLLRQAFREATSGAPGPVHLQIQNRGGQTMEQEADIDALVEKQYACVPAFRPEPDIQHVRDALAALAKARRPVIVAGGGVVRSSAQRELVALAEKLRIPVITSLKAKGTIIDSHPLSVGVSGSYSRDCANSTLNEADLVFFVGSGAGGHVTHFWHFPSAGTPVIQLDISPSELGRNYPNAVSILGDAKVALQRMLDAAQPKSPDAAKAWTGRVQEIVAKWRAENEPHRNSDAVPIRPERICKEISEVLPPDCVVVSDTGHAGIWTGTMIDFKYATQRYFPCAGSLGWGFPAALGVKCALPDKPVLCFTGDGGFYYHIAELETARRWNINLVVLVNNNNALNQEITLNINNYNGKPRGNWTDLWTFTDNNFAKIAEAFGCVGIRVEKPGEIRDAVTRAFGMNKPVVIDVVSDVNVLAKRVPIHRPT
ncbi:MAG: thiamine pyrophosphate-binding protein [Betaproteobacteria bacterium]|nr:thiamine pyrophosphate-binding protein [Betaproteobacteria bacterium]